MLNDRVAARRQVYEYYHANLAQEPGLQFMPEAAYGCSTRWLTCILIDPTIFGATCDDVRRHLEANNIESRPAWKPMHLQPVFRDCRSVGGHVAAHIFEQGLCLPSGSALSTVELNRVVSTLLSVPRHKITKHRSTSPSTSVSRATSTGQMVGCLVDADSGSWSDVLREVRHDFYHRPQYAQICALQEHNSLPRAFIARDDEGVFLVPFLLRPVRTERGSSPIYDAVTPYGYSSPLLKVKPGCDPNQFMERAIRSMIDTLAAEGIVAAFVRLHPLLPIPLEPLRKSGTLVEHGETVYLDLRRSLEDLSAATDKKTRKKIRRAKEEGFTTEVDVDWVHLDEFEELYAETMQHANAAPEYLFSHEYFAAMRDQMRDCMHLLITRCQGEIVSAVIVSETSGIVQYHLGGRRVDFALPGATWDCLDFARTWFKHRGNDSFHLGGGVGGKADSVYRFKSTFSKDRSSFHTWRLILCPKVYQELVQNWESEADMPAAGPTGYFPEYRVPLPVSVF